MAMDPVIRVIAGFRCQWRLINVYRPGSEEVTGMHSTSAPSAVRTARRASNSPAAHFLAPAGVVAVLVALGQSKHEADQLGALQLLAGKSYGLVALWLLGIGFAAYALWRLREAAFGGPGEANGAGPRLKSLGRAIIYAAFSYLTFT